ncbi:MAG: CsgG/HfaB family protein, partial [Candidatus Krumholzibacteriia bacterium]
ITGMLLAVTIAGLLVPATSRADAMGLKYRVIVGEFEDKAEHGWYHGPGPGEGMADMLITALVKTGKFRVFERAALDEILAEKNLNLSDLASENASVAQKLEIGDILVKATITEFGYKQGEVGGSVAKGYLKKASVGSYTGRVAVDLRIIDLGTGEVLWADAVNKTETSRSLGVSTEQFSLRDTDKFDDHVVGKATRKVIDAVVDKLEDQVEKRPWQGVLITADTMLFIDGGTELGIQPGMRFEVKRKDKEVKHPRTGKVLKVLYSTLGEIRTTEVEDGITTCEAVSGGDFATGDVVTLKR